MIEHYRTWFEHEKHANAKMLDMIDSVPDARRGDDRFGRVVRLAAHLTACRENFLSFFRGGEKVAEWWDDSASLGSLRPRFDAMEWAWTEYFAQAADTDMEQTFEISEGGGRWRFPIEAQVYQLFGHAAYHRGQVAILVDQLGGETVDTDYIDWVWEKDPRCAEVT